MFCKLTIRMVMNFWFAWKIFCTSPNVPFSFYQITSELNFLIALYHTREYNRKKLIPKFGLISQRRKSRKPYP